MFKFTKSKYKVFDSFFNLVYLSDFLFCKFWGYSAELLKPFNTMIPVFLSNDGMIW